MLQQVLHLVFGEPSGCVSGTPGNLACQIWDLMDSHFDRHEYASCMLKAVLVDADPPTVRRDENHSSCCSGGL